jgi:hypothetical protein
MDNTAIVPAVAPNWPEFNPASHSANTTYMVTTNKTISGSVTIASNVTLVFGGGKFTGISICDLSNTPVAAFNNYSYFR